MRLENALVVCNWDGLFLQSCEFSVWKVDAFLSLGLKNSLFTSSEPGFSALKLLNNKGQNACNDLKEFFIWDTLQH